MASNLNDDLTIPGTTVLIGNAKEIKLMGLREDNESFILLPQPSSDFDDPLNWSFLRKHVHFTILFFFGLIMGAATNYSGPSYSLLTEMYNVSYNQLNTGSGLAFLFLAFGCLFAQPFANKFGRRPVYLFNTLMMVFSSVIIVKEKSYAGYIGSNILNGFAGGPMDSLIQVSITDMFFLHEHGKYISIYSLTLGLGSAFGPLIAGYTTEHLGFYWCGYLLIIVCGSLLLFEFFFLEESHYDRHYDLLEEELDDKLLKIAISNTSNGESHTNIDQSLAKEKNISSVNVLPAFDSNEDKSPKIDYLAKHKSYFERLKPFSIYDTPLSPLSVLKCLKVLRYPAVVWAALAYGIQVCWLSLISVSESEFYSAPPYYFSDDALGLLNIAMIVGTLIGGFYSSLSDIVQIYFTRRNNGIFEPEFRLLMLPVPIACNIIGLFMYGLGPYYGVHWVVGAIGISLISIGLCSITSLSLTYVLECYPKQANESMTSVLFVRNVMATIFTFVFQFWLDGVGEIGTTSMLAAFCLLINGAFIIIYIWGKRFRKYTQKWYENQ